MSEQTKVINNIARLKFFQIRRLITININVINCEQANTASNTAVI